LVYQYYLISYIGQEEIRRGTVGAVQPKLPIKNIQSIKLILPPLQKQKQISRILTALDDKIALNTKINENLRCQAA
jgi:type I restriction enzyme S subunit